MLLAGQLMNTSISDCSDYAELLKPKTSIPGAPGEIPHKRLSDIMKVELLADKTADEIAKIWLDYHKEKDVLVATIPTETFNLLTARGKESPIFILPLPRSQGYEFFLLQFASNTVHFTPLLCYQVHISLFFLFDDMHKCTAMNIVCTSYFVGSQGECTRMLECRPLYRTQRKAWHRFDARRIRYECHQCPRGPMFGQPIAIILFTA